ncbi:hypothetical protein EC973_001781 [Apophysomyces ossiformis]|uniref:Uncharacterized protein n=1 Tax=Apophysomyces ossiformis TaxID=679940 RepID=A0A8H7BLI7_9FUNG|nr:hypothetical protein EC973_001781 [Apophysomyces ossiformis]
MDELDSDLFPWTDENCTSVFENKRRFSIMLMTITNWNMLSISREAKITYVSNLNGKKTVYCVHIARNSFNSLSAIRKHLKRLGGKYSLNPDLNDENDVVHIPLPDCPLYDDSLPVPPDPSRRHSFTEAVVQACQSMEASEDERSKNEWIIGKLQIEAMALIEGNESTQKAEYSAFTHAVNIRRMTGKRFICHPIISAKRKLRKSSFDEILAISFAHLIHSSPLPDILLQRQYFEVNHQVCQMLTFHW